MSQGSPSWMIQNVANPIVNVFVGRFGRGLEFLTTLSLPGRRPRSYLHEHAGHVKGAFAVDESSGAAEMPREAPKHPVFRIRTGG